MMGEIIELDDVDGLGTGAVGEPGKRAFYIQARTGHAQLTVLVEKEQVALLATEAVAFLDSIADDYPEAPAVVAEAEAQLREPTVPLFRARLIGLGFDPERELVLLEFRDARPRTRTRTTSRGESGSDDSDDEDDEDEGYVARIYATRAQVRAMAARRRRRVQGASRVPVVRHADGPGRTQVPALELTPEELEGALHAAELEVVGRMRYSSNATFLVEARVDGMELAAVYKPRRGERPLWDFPHGTLCNREVAAYHLSRARSGGTSSRSRSCATDRSGRARFSGSSSTIPTSTTSRCSTGARTASGSSPSSTSSPTTPIGRAGTACATSRTTRSWASTTASRSTPLGSCAR